MEASPVRSDIGEEEEGKRLRRNYYLLFITDIVGKFFFLTGMGLCLMRFLLHGLVFSFLLMKENYQRKFAKNFRFYIWLGQKIIILI